MNIIFHKNFYQQYSDEGAADKGRMESIIDELKIHSEFHFIEPESAKIEDLSLAHTDEHINYVKSKSKIYEMALLSLGGAIKAATLGAFSKTSMAIIRPPGHHAYKNQSWGYCYFSNMAISLLKLKTMGMINSAFILDFDAHTGDGTIDVLKDLKEIKILNPMAEKEIYIQTIDDYIKDLNYVDIIAVCAGFDSYEKDVGRKLSTFDFYTIGKKMKKLSNKMGHNRRFAILEGGYYLPDLGKNVLSFCQGFE